MNENQQDERANDADPDVAEAAAASAPAVETGSEETTAAQAIETEQAETEQAGTEQAGTEQAEAADGADAAGPEAPASEAPASEAPASDESASDPAGDTAVDDLTEPDPEIVPPSGAELRAIVECLVFAAPEPITARQLVQLLPGVPKPEINAALEELRAEHQQPGRGLQLVEVAGGWQITTRAEYNEWLRQLLDPKSVPKLTIKALETLAVIAYKQPVTLPEIIELRGVKSGGVVKTLLERHLVKIVGRKEVVGRPMLYGTTRNFLLQFGLKDLSDLPKIEEFAEVLGEEVDVLGLKRAIEAPRPVEVPLSEDEVSAESSEGTPSGSSGASSPATEPLVDDTGERPVDDTGEPPVDDSDENPSA